MPLSRNKLWEGISTNVMFPEKQWKQCGCLVKQGKSDKCSIVPALRPNQCTGLLGWVHPPILYCSPDDELDLTTLVENPIFH